MKPKDFQQRTIDHVFDRLYVDAEKTNRFLVADEVGLGKTVVARGVIDKVIQRLRGCDDIERIDIVYICSNAAIARQNLTTLSQGLPVERPSDTRLTMLATQTADLGYSPEDGSKPVNLVSLTPGTSFNTRRSTGRADERALMNHLVKAWVQSQGGSIPRRTANAVERIFQFEVAERTWKSAQMRSVKDRAIDPLITDKFHRRLSGAPEGEELLRLVGDFSGVTRWNDDRRARARTLIGSLRALLAASSIDALEPDLIILDEFQRFRDLLDPPPEGASDITRLAADLLDYQPVQGQRVKVLLLSATPYRLYTLPEERLLDGEDHYRDFLDTVRMLSRGTNDGLVDEVAAALARLRSAMTTQTGDGAASSGSDVARAREEVERLLRTVMVRTERPVRGLGSLVRTECDGVAAPTPEDLVSFARMRAIAAKVDAPLPVDYWKSTPYFLNFMDGYQLGARLQERIPEDDSLPPLVREAGALAKDDLDGETGAAEAGVDLGNARLRALADRTIGRGLWRLLWLPPSLPYHSPGGVYAEVGDPQPTKHLIFSSWAAAPTAIAALLSHDARRRMLGGRPLPDGSRLAYGLSPAGRPDAMTTFALFVPLPGLAERSDPRVLARELGSASGAAPVPLEDIESAVALHMADELPEPGRPSPRKSQDTWYWATPFVLGWAGDSFCHPSEGEAPVLAQAPADASPPTNEPVPEAGADTGNGQVSEGLREHLRRACAVVGGREELGSQPSDLGVWLARLGLASPANCAWRALRRTLGQRQGITDDGIWWAAFTIAEGFRTLFNRDEVRALLGQMHSGPGDSYWQTVLSYCLDGNLQAVLDEYLHHRVERDDPRDDDDLAELAASVASCVALRAANLEPRDPRAPGEPLKMPVGFALRFGSAKGTATADQKAVTRQSDVRDAFNSPFWPMVLASTSVGQEGMDFHWWCHSLVHWNLPSNPVDLEQREGRVQRYKGHAVRRNVALAHGAAALASLDYDDPWQAAFDLALSVRSEDVAREVGDLWPWWVFHNGHPGESHIDCWVPAIPLSADRADYARLSRERGLYRLAFGQPRQEDLVALLEGGELSEVDLAGWRIDLRPPARRQPVSSSSSRGLSTSTWLDPHHSGDTVDRLVERRHPPDA